MTRKNGFRDGITDLLAHQYSKKTHFIFELLQNAEDAGASEVVFHVEREQLVFSHNGERLFSDENVDSITSIGRSTKQKDYTQIGKHGIGFKAVFAYTHAPRIHSGDKHFEIEDLVVPRMLTDEEVPTDIERGETRIVLPFDSEKIPESSRFREMVDAASALVDISAAMRQLSARTLLFLRHIKKICWTLPDGAGGTYLREPQCPTDQSVLRHVAIDGHRTETWAVFEQSADVSDDGQNHQCIVEVAFLIRDGKVVQAQDTELVVYFPTEKKTELGFLIQGPFKTTKARDNIALDSRANHQLIEAAAELAANSLEDLRDYGFLDASSYLALPIRLQDFPKASFFRVVCDQVRAALKTKPLLPVNGGGFVKADEARLAGVGELIKLFSRQQLEVLFDNGEMQWLDSRITETGRFADFHAYLVGRKLGREWQIEPLADGIQVDPEALVTRLTAEFLAAQDVTWLIRFIAYAKHNQTMQKTPLVRLENGQQVRLPVEGQPPTAYLSPSDASGVDLSEFPLVARALVEDEETKAFLLKAPIRDVDKIAIVERCILAKYPPPSGAFDEPGYRRDLQLIQDALIGSANSARNGLEAQARNKKWVACRSASGTHPQDVAWKLPGDKAVFSRSPELEEWFGGANQGTSCFLHPAADELINTKLRNSFGIASGSLIKRCSPNPYPHRRSEGGFDGDADIVGLEDALNSISMKKAKFLWNILLENIPLIQGKELRSSNLQFPVNKTWEVNISPLGKSCMKHAWLPVQDREGFFRPAEILLLELPDDFERNTPRAEALSRALNMKQPEREQALDIVTGGDPILRKLIEQYQSGSDADRENLKKMIPKEVPSRPAPSFMDGIKRLSRSQRGVPRQENTDRAPVSNRERYQQQLNERVEEGVKTHLTSSHIVTFSPVRSQLSNSEAREFLYKQYAGCCQVTNNTFPKASANAEGVAENYFEACALLSYSNADYLNDAGNMLSVSADTMAKLKNASFEWLDDLEGVVEQYQPGRTATARIRLAGQEAQITWSERHFMRLIALWKEA